MIPRTVTARDGTALRAWRTGGGGIPVVLSNGLGAPAEAWPRLVGDPRFDVVGWDHRGLGGSARPADESRVRVEDHADDLLAVMDAERLPRALVVGWSIGVGVAFEVARAHPERVAGVLAVAGMPGGTFGAVFGPMPVPKRLRPRAASLAARALAYVGPAVRVGAGVLAPKDQPWQEWTTPSAWASASAHALRAFARHDWRWYSHLVRAAEHHAAMDLSGVQCPSTFVGGTYDLITSAEEVRAAARAVPNARYVELPGSHYLPLEFPEALDRELAALAERAGLR